MSELHHTPATVALPDTRSEELNDRFLWIDSRYYELATRDTTPGTKERMDALTRVGKSLIRTMDDTALVTFVEENYGITDFDPVMRYGGRDMVGHRAERKKADRTIRSIRLRAGAQVIRSYISLREKRESDGVDAAA